MCVIQPVLLQNEGGDGGRQRPHEAVESPPVVLQDEPGENDEAAQRVVDEHHLGGAAQNPVQQLQQNKLPWKTKVHLSPSQNSPFRSHSSEVYILSIHFPKGAMSPAK